MRTSAGTFPYTQREPGLGVAAVFGKGSVVTLFAQVTSIDEGWARRVRLPLHSSIGDFSVEAHLDKLPDPLKAGDWVRLQAMRRHGEGETPLTVIGLKLACPDCKAAWLPVALYHRHAHMQRLRRLLEVLDPGLQLVFTLALADAQAQRRFFWRVAASDHRVYPGGLFDQSVEAAEQAWAGDEPKARLRGLASMTALLFDLGKTSDEQLNDDGSRAHEAFMAPHRFTARSLERAFDRARCVAPDPVDDLRAVLFAPASSISLELQRAARLARLAVLQSLQAGAER